MARLKKLGKGWNRLFTPFGLTFGSGTGEDFAILFNKS
jgi:hypothetical protein